MMTSRVFYVLLVLIVTLSFVVVASASSIRGHRKFKTKEQIVTTHSANDSSASTSASVPNDASATTVRALKQKRTKDTPAPTLSPTLKPTMSPTPKPTMNPIYTGIEKPKNKKCVSWCSRKATVRSWKKVCTWGKCDGCNECASDKDEKPNPSPNPERPLTCFYWCEASAEKNPNSWDEVCTWNKCNGCNSCLPGGLPKPGQQIQKCAEWCADHESSWGEVCTYENCNGCNHCTYEDDDIAWRCPENLDKQRRFFDDYPRGEDCSCCTYYDWQFGDGSCCKPVIFQ